MGIKVQHDSSILQLYQTMYALDLLKRAAFLLAKSFFSPIATSTKLSHVDVSLLVDATA